jgi:hypothetical protein
MQPAASLVQDNWFSTENTMRLRGGSQTWCSLPETTPVKSLFSYVTGTAKKMFAANASKLYEVTSATATLIPGIIIADGHFSTAQLANAASYWLIACNDTGDYPLRYNGIQWSQLAAGNARWLNNTAYAVGSSVYDPDLGTHWRCLVAHTSPASGNFAAYRGANPTHWIDKASDDGQFITGPPGSPVEHGLSLTQVWKYRRRLFFIQGRSMDAWHLDIDAVGGLLKQIPLSGAFTKGGYLLFGCAWSVSAGDGIDDKCIFVTSEGEIAVFTGTNPTDAANWKQQGRYQISRPMGKNAWLNIGGDVLIITVDGIVPISQALVKDITALEFSALTRSIHPLWSEEVLDKNDLPWSMCKWDEFGGLFVTTPGGSVGDWRCFVANTVTGAWCRFTGWDALQFCSLSGNMFFGTQDGRIVQADVLGKDYSSTRPPTPAQEGTGAWPLRPYTCVHVGGWETFGGPPFTFTLRQARCSFNTRASEPFIPFMTACIDYVIEVPPAPPAGPDFGPAEVWDEGLWGAGTVPPPTEPPPEANEPGAARWDQPGSGVAPTRSTMWVSIGETGVVHAMIVQVSVFQQARPDVEMLGISMLAEKAGVAV